ncbi:hypothetical protein BX661DRAFT_182187 [Kickxella alabastrina]|uniref:uncharacterized protein n=1 Tax=Kickxella alabastrina TaxID=61397 RepID=UPI00222128DE|nr:uncharacterized protein BX661DRAFT_182187 [Kickxella alabastrina]KAI7828489.1 hypothetical protein BX661DRAFT_182187 [Kickxella alabastrina]
MSTVIQDIDGADTNTGKRMSKELDSLPMPSTTPASRNDRSMANNKFVLFLQYLNPLFYARLAQSFIYSVLESYRGDRSSNFNSRITAGEMVPAQGLVPADASAIDCGMPTMTEFDINDQFTTISPEFEFLPQLNIDSMRPGFIMKEQHVEMVGGNAELGIHIADDEEHEEAVKAKVQPSLMEPTVVEQVSKSIEAPHVNKVVEQEQEQRLEQEVNAENVEVSVVDIVIEQEKYQEHDVAGLALNANPESKISKKSKRAKNRAKGKN